MKNETDNVQAAIDDLAARVKQRIAELPGSLVVDVPRIETLPAAAASPQPCEDALAKLCEYIWQNSTRGECQCGKCCDKGPDRNAPQHSINVHFFWVGKTEACSAVELRRLIELGYPRLDRLAAGPSYIEMGGELGSQELALRLIGIGKLCELWDEVTPERMGATGKVADQMAGSGFVMCTGLQGALASAPPQAEKENPSE